MAFSMDGGNLLGMFSETDEESCRKKCAEDEKCSYYTIHLADRYLMPNTCTLMSASSKPEVCKSCRTGPKSCNFYENCKPNEAVIMSASNLSSSQKIETNETIKIDTMGCTVKANLLAVGGGGTGGRDSFSSSATRYGGGGSGFLDYSIISIPFTKRFFTYVGKGWEKGRESSSYTSHRVSYYDEYADHFAEPQEQSNLKSTSNYYAGQNTMVISEDGEVIADAKGGEGGYSTAGGDGFSGGGSEGGQCGGSNGDNGGSSNQDKGGNGSGIDIRRDVQPLFREFELEPAPGGRGSTKSSSRVASGGGGGGGVFVNGRSYSYGQGGDGYDSSRPPHGNSGVILFEIQF
ncbi:loricrin-like isoform X2 [Symsagittifera roscoffensis]|uniref:loricrin-like isoform X2 n=1 Tax=Symsagittifera roscoffensis TaxID=84072 RepID=UPI00307BC69E